MFYLLCLNFPVRVIVMLAGNYFCSLLFAMSALATLKHNDILNKAVNHIRPMSLVWSGG